jgi:hypothetical protein
MKFGNGWKDVRDFPIVRTFYVLHAVLEMQRPIPPIHFAVHCHVQSLSLEVEQPAIRCVLMYI